MTRLAVALAAALLAPPAIAQPSEAARAYIEASGFAASVASLVPSVVAQQEAALRQAMPMANEEAMAAYLGFFAEELEARLPELEARVADLADAMFTEAQLREITAFFETEIGRAHVEGGVRMQQDVFMLMRNWGAGAGEEAAQRAQERLEEKGLEL